jgi:hypothetical protein
MSKRFLTSLKLLNLSSDPSSADNGDMYYNSSTNKAKIYKNGSWSSFASSLQDLDDVSDSGLSNGQVLTYNGSLDMWEGKSSPPAATATGTSFPGNPSDGEFFFNTTTEKLYFFYIAWNEISFTTINLEGGTSSTQSFDNSFDGGTSSTAIFVDGTYDAGDSFTSY